MNCPNCNNPLAPHQKFCDLCGTPVEQESVNAAPAFQEEFAPQEPTLPDTPSYGDDFVQQPQPPQPEAPVYTLQPVYAQPPQDQYHSLQNTCHNDHRSSTQRYRLLCR